MNEIQIERISLLQLIRRFWTKVVFTWLLVLADGLLHLLFPLAIGIAVGDLVAQKYEGLIGLGILCALVLGTGGARRFYDTRVYAGIYRIISRELVEREKRKGADISRTSARANLFTEIVEFLENSLPEIIHQLINFVGTLAVIALIDLHIFLNCTLGAIFTLIVFAISEKKTVALHKGMNDEQERQVAVIAAKNPGPIDAHFSKMMRWNIRLSDLETWNFAAIWVILACVLVSSIATTVRTADADYGRMIAAIMYVFGFIESVMIFPLFYQQLLRLGDISRRLSGD